MALTKTNTAIWNGETFTAGSTHADSSVQDLSDSYASQLHIKITNGATGPTDALHLQIRVSADNSEFYDFGGPCCGDTGNGETYSWSIQIPIGIEYLKIVSDQTNTDQDVTVDVDITEVTAV